MSLSPLEQFSELAEKAEHPIIFIPKYPSKDAVASAVALSLFFEKRGKRPVLAGDQVASRLGELPFLPQPAGMIETLSGSRDFVLSFNTKHNRILSAKSEQLDDEFRILITPEKGSIDPRDFSFIPAQFPFDIAFVIGSPDKESLGTIYEENPDIFYEVPVVNIDNRSENEQFGQLNLVELTSSSVSEILFDAISVAGETATDERIAECLLSGIIAATESFQKKNTTPKALKIASTLIEQGADREKIVLALYKTQSFNLLRLWGRVMSKLKWDEELKLAYAEISIDDFVQSRATKDDLPEVLEQIRSHFSSGAYFAATFPDTQSTRIAMIKSASGRIPTSLQSVPGIRVQGDTATLPLEDGSEEVFLDLMRNTLS